MPTDDVLRVIHANEHRLAADEQLEELRYERGQLVDLLGVPMSPERRIDRQRRLTEIDEAIERALTYRATFARIVEG